MNTAEWGRLVIYLGAAGAVAATVLFALAAKYEGWLAWARRAYALAVFSAVTAFGILVLLCMRSDFSVVYVANFSSSDLPWYYKLSSAWAGQEGSFLLWAFWTAVLGLLLIRRLKRYEPLTMAVYSSILAFLMAILTKQSPFLQYPPSEVPPEGMGLNPLLQNYWMAIHPPTIFIGFASLAIPFSIAVAALLRKDWDGWVQNRHAVCHPVLGNAGRGADTGRLLGVRDARLGRFLGLGPCGKLLAGALAGDYGADSWSGGAAQSRWATPF
jgi:cytochrome c-type biogenesis protein CcmF